MDAPTCILCNTKHWSRESCPTNTKSGGGVESRHATQRHDGSVGEYPEKGSGADEFELRTGYSPGAEETQSRVACQPGLARAGSMASAAGVAPGPLDQSSGTATLVPGGGTQNTAAVPAPLKPRRGDREKYNARQREYMRNRRAKKT